MCADNGVAFGATPIPDEPPPAPIPQHATLPADAPTLGPAAGPSMAPVEDDMIIQEGDDPPQSPYTASRLAVRKLTMPPVPNFDIPPSPPGSPPPGPTAKFAKFLELKKQGVHFNEKLQNSSALRNPGLLQKLMDFADISEEDSHATTLPADVAPPTKFPKWAYAEELGKTQQEMLKKKEAGRVGKAPEFVSAADSAGPSRTSTPGAKASTVERVVGSLGSSGRRDERGDGRSKRARR